MTLDRMKLSAQTVRDNIAILEEVQEPDDAGYYLQLEHEKRVLKALEKRIPKKVKVEQFNRYNIYYCPTCDGCIGDSLGHIGDGFCSSCGQAIDWSDT